MQIRKLSRYVYDVFDGVGFDQWTRIRKFHWGFKVVNGKRLQRNEMQTVIQRIEQYPNGSINNV